MSIAQPLKESYIPRATDYIDSVADPIEKYQLAVEPLIAEREQLKQRLKQIENEIEKHAGLRHKIGRLVRRFARYAQRRKDDFVNGGKRTVKTGSGSFGWRLNPSDSLVCDPGLEHKAIKRLIELERWDLLDCRLRKDPIKAALQSGDLRSIPGLSVIRSERFLVAPSGLWSVSLFEDGHIKLQGER
ncbi:MAG TPA: host-nuclease inhibitor Gam family protein [Patescibacteria group bacterium]|nr:host-nuclease inhibitor Gam family protein [Patescibacteria group bacterium]